MKLGDIIRVMVKRSLLFIFFILLILVFLVVFKMNQDNLELNKVCFENYCFDVELAQKAEERARGLMFRESLEEDKGMLFIFEKEGKHSFWMKNTLISLDIIWINKEREVVYIEKNAQPCGEEGCPSINPDKKIKYVLEISGGLTDKINLKIGDKLIFE